MAKSYSQVSYGSSGSDVKNLQKLLNKNGYSLDEDGIFGKKTQSAVQDYQKKNNLKVDGIVGNNTWAALTGASSSSASTGVGGGGKPITSTAETGFTHTAYEDNAATKQAKNNWTQHTAQKPGPYQSAWQTQLTDTINKILNREEFSYDLNGDALYQQYKGQYTTQGKMAMMDTMGQAQAMTGGYGNSYAQSVGQQAYQGYLQQLNDKIPELYQLALDKYNQEGQDLYNQYSMLGAQDDRDYNRHRDTVSDWQIEEDRLQDIYYNERDFGYNAWADDRDFRYGVYSDDRAYNYQVERDKVADKQWQAEFDEAKRLTELQYGQSSGKSSGSSGGKTSSSGNTTANPSTNPTGNPNPSPTYDTHGYSKEQIMSLQKAAGIKADGIWGPDTQKAYEKGFRPDSNGGNVNPELSAAAQKFVNNLPYAHSGTTGEQWKNFVLNRLKNSTLSAADKEAIAYKLGL